MQLFCSEGENQRSRQPHQGLTLWTKGGKNFVRGSAAANILKGSKKQEIAEKEFRKTHTGSPICITEPAPVGAATSGDQ